MTAWELPRHRDHERQEYVATFVVVSTPQGLTCRWEDRLPSAEVRAVAVEFASRMSDGALEAGRPLKLTDEHIELIEMRMGPEAARKARVNRQDPPEHWLEGEQPVYLRLKIRATDDMRLSSGSRGHVVDFEFGPSGAPAEYPRLPVTDLFRHAAANA